MVAIVAVGTSLPDFVATNEYVISLAAENSRRLHQGSLDDLVAELRKLLHRAGADRRQWRAGFTKPIEHIAEAWNNCIGKFGRRSIDQIGALIYCGIDKGIAEPSHASLLAKQFGVTGARTLDIADACMGWLTAAQVASCFTTRAKPYAAIVSAEFPIEVPGKVYPDAFKIRDRDDLLWKAAALTLGEAAAVTIINAAATMPEPIFVTQNEFSDLCCVPLERPERFVDLHAMLKRLADGCFIANMPKMASAGYKAAREVLQRYIALHGVPDIVLPHTVSQTMPQHISKDLLPPGALRNCFPIFGNIATCSLPVGYEYFDCAEKRGLHIAGWIAAAGMSHSVFRIT